MSPGRTCLVIKGDIRDIPKNQEEIIQRTIGTFKKIGMALSARNSSPFADILVNNAGIQSTHLSLSVLTVQTAFQDDFLKISVRRRVL